MAAFLKHPTGSRPLPNAYATPMKRGRILPRVASTNRTVDDNFSSPPLLSPDDFVLNSSNTVTETSGVILSKFWDGDADLFSIDH